jgi:tripeptidyl-peptidase-1
VAFNIGGRADDDTCLASPSSCFEPNLDIQYITAIGANISTWFYGDSNIDFLSTWLPTVSSLNPVPSVLSISYGMYESDVSSDVQDDFDSAIVSLSLLGTTMVAGSGDDGVAGPSARTDATKCGYKPFWPSTSPYVLSVGGTQVTLRQIIDYALT